MKSETPSKHQAPRILVIDDEPDVLMIMAKRLMDAGFEVITADDGKAGIQLASEKSPDLIVLDILMPGLSGGETARHLGANHATSNIPILFLSAIVSGGDPDVNHIMVGDLRYPAYSKLTGTALLIAAIKKILNL